jgi:DNA-binding MarR family transcriptional regulator
MQKTVEIGIEEFSELKLDEFLSFLLTHAYHHCHEELLEILRPHSIKVGQWRILSVLAVRPCLSVNELVAATLMEQPRVSRLLEQMEEDEFICRVKHTDDRRRLVVSLDNKGTETVRAVLPKLQNLSNYALRGFDKKETKTLFQLLKKVINNFEGLGQKY